MSVEPPARELALVFCMFFSIYTVFASLLFAIFARALVGVAIASLLTAMVATLQGVAAFGWLRGPLALGAAQGWGDLCMMWYRGRLATRSVRVWLTSTVLLPASFINQAICLTKADGTVLTIGALVLASEGTMFIGAVAGLLVSGMQSRAIQVQDL